MDTRGLTRRDLTRSLVIAVLVGIGVVVALILAYQALSILKLAAVAVLMALVLRTVVTGLERLGAPPLLSSFILLAGLAAFGALVYFVVIPNVVQQVRVLVSQGPGSLSAVSDVLRGLPFAPDLSEAGPALRARPLGGGGAGRERA